MPGGKIGRHVAAALPKKRKVRGSSTEKKPIERRQIWHYLCRAHNGRRKTYRLEIAQGAICPKCLKNRIPENQPSLFEKIEAGAKEAGVETTIIK